MRRQGIKYSVSLVLIAFVAYNSVYFRRLDEVTASAEAKVFDATLFARNFHDNLLPARLDSAVDLGFLISALRTEPDKAFTQYSNSLAVGNIHYFLAQGQGIIANITDTNITVELSGTTKGNVLIETEFVYGNAIRDASGLVKLEDFPNTADLNSISENINGIVRNEIIPAFAASAKLGSQISFAGAVELNQKHVDLESVEVTPVRLVITKQ